MTRITQTTGKLAGCAALVLAGWFVGQSSLPLSAQPNKNRPPIQNAAATTPDYDKNIVAYVNNEPITRLELAEELIARRGKQHVTQMINKRILEQACRKAGVVITDAEVDADIKEVLEAANCRSIRNFEDTVLKQQNMTLSEYKEDVVRVYLAKKKLCASRVEVTETDLQRAFEANYGEKVKCRIILFERSPVGKQNALQTHTKINGDREEFITQARVQATPNLAAGGGEIRPINRHSQYPDLEKAAFSLTDGEISKVIEVPEGYVLILREQLLPKDKKITYENVKDELTRKLFEKLVRAKATETFDQLRKEAAIRDYLNTDSNILQVMQELPATKSK